MFDRFALVNFDDELAGTRAKSITFDAVLWLEQVRTAVPRRHTSPGNREP